jgi:phage terminase large subunit-like protein
MTDHPTHAGSCHCGRVRFELRAPRPKGIPLIQELKGGGLSMVKGIKPEGDKTMRLNAQTATIENGFVYLPRETSWLRDYLAEMTSFPKAKHADRVDSTSQALAWIKNSMYGAGMGLFHYMREQADLVDPGISARLSSRS